MIGRHKPTHVIYKTYRNTALRVSIWSALICGSRNKSLAVHKFTKECEMRTKFYFYVSHGIPSVGLFPTSFMGKSSLAILRSNYFDRKNNTDIGRSLHKKISVHDLTTLFSRSVFLSVYICPSPEPAYIRQYTWEKPIIRGKIETGSTNSFHGMQMRGFICKTKLLLTPMSTWRTLCLNFNQKNYLLTKQRDTVLFNIFSIFLLLLNF